MSSATVAATSNKPTSRRYIEDNDPEYADLDEEDPDDDLDISTTTSINTSWTSK